MVIFALLIFPLLLLALLLGMERVERLLVTPGPRQADPVPTGPQPARAAPAAEQRRPVASVRLLPGRSS